MDIINKIKYFEKILDPHFDAFIKERFDRLFHFTSKIDDTMLTLRKFQFNYPSPQYMKNNSYISLGTKSYTIGENKSFLHTDPHTLEDIESILFNAQILNVDKNDTEYLTEFLIVQYLWNWKYNPDTTRLVYYTAVPELPNEYYLMFNY